MRHRAGRGSEKKDCKRDKSTSSHAVKTAEAPWDRLTYWILEPTLLLYTVVERTTRIVANVILLEQAL